MLLPLGCASKYTASFGCSSGAVGVQYGAVSQGSRCHLYADALRAVVFTGTAATADCVHLRAIGVVGCLAAIGGFDCEAASDPVITLSRVAGAVWAWRGGSTDVMCSLVHWLTPCVGQVIFVTVQYATVPTVESRVWSHCIPASPTEMAPSAAAALAACDPPPAAVGAMHVRRPGEVTCTDALEWTAADPVPFWLTFNAARRLEVNASLCDAIRAGVVPGATYVADQWASPDASSYRFNLGAFYAGRLETWGIEVPAAARGQPQHWRGLKALWVCALACHGRRA